MDGSDGRLVRCRREVSSIDGGRKHPLGCIRYERLSPNSPSIPQAYCGWFLSAVSCSLGMGKRYRVRPNVLVSQRQIRHVHSLGSIFAGERGGLMADHGPEGGGNFGGGISCTAPNLQSGEV